MLARIHWGGGAELKISPAITEAAAASGKAAALDPAPSLLVSLFLEHSMQAVSSSLSSSSSSSSSSAAAVASTAQESVVAAL